MIEPVMGHGVVDIQDLIDDANCYRKVRELRWPEGVRCPFCGDEHRLKHGFDSTQKQRLPALLRRSDRDYFRRPSSTLASLDLVLVFHGLESV